LIIDARFRTAKTLDLVWIWLGGDYGNVFLIVDGIHRTITESSLRRNLKLQDEEGINVSQGEACRTDSGFIADQERTTIAKSSTLPYDSAPWVTSPVADEGSMQQTILELMALCTSLQRQLLELTAKFQARERRAEQIARDAEVARIHVEEELQSMIDGLDRNNKTIAKDLQEYHQFSSELLIERRVELISDLVKSNLGWKVKDFRGMMFEEVEEKFNSVWKQIEDFIPIGSKEEAERIKRKEVNEEKVKEMMQLVLIEEVYAEALQVKHPIIDWKVYTEGQKSYWKITRLGGSSANYQFFIDLLKHLDREDLNQLWRLVKETLSNRPPTSEKEMELWLYDSCGVHHVTSKDKEIFMLVEKDYPLRKGLALVMICYKLQVENFLQMANDLVLKIYKIANSLRQQGD
nr:hypothetical protein [Tanacetum cinerariifolium]